MTLDPDVVRFRCQEIAQSLQRLEGIRTHGRDHFTTSADAQDVACYRLLVAIEAALALCYHVSARRLRTAPEDYAGCFETLEKAGVIDVSLSRRLQPMAKVRNLLVHVYWTMDRGRVFDVLEHDLDDLRACSRVVAALV